MPFIQCEFQHGLSEAEKTRLLERIVEVVHEHLGSPLPFISAVIREWSGCNMVEAGEIGRRFERKLGPD